MLLANLQIKRCPNILLVLIEIMSLRIQRPGSPSLALLHDLQSRGYTIGDLSRLAHNAKLGVIRDILYEYCTSMLTCGISLATYYSALSY